MTDSLEIEDQGLIRILHMTGRPKRGNPLSKELANALCGAIVEAEQDDSLLALVLTGTETHFSVGADLAEVSQLTASKAVLTDWLDEFDRISRSSKPVIAAIRGHAVGGGLELALACDLIVCADDARLSLPETGIGVIAGQGGTQRLISLAGRAVATDMILTGRVVMGSEAVSLGIASRCCAPENVIGEALSIANAITKRSPAAVRFAREVLREAAEGHLRQSFRIERLLASVILDTNECKRRVGDFLEKKR